MPWLNGITIKKKIGEIVLPGFGGVPFSHVVRFVIKGFQK